MPSRASLWLAAVMVVAAALSVHADVDDPSSVVVEPSFSASIGLEVTFTPVPPLSFDVGSALRLTLAVAAFTFASETQFALSGFESQRFDAALRLGSVTLSELVVFEPLFAWNQLAVHAEFFCIHGGVEWILANIGSPQTPSYSMGGVIQVGATPLCGVSALSLTGFGVVDLLQLVGGIDAPFSYRLLRLFRYLDELCAGPEELQVTVLPGFYFEEQVLRVEVDALGLLASSTTWFDWMGFARETIEIGFAFVEPELAFLMSVTLDAGLTVGAMDFILDLYVAPVGFASRTRFLAPPSPTPVPIGFDGQQFALSVEAIGILFSFDTSFDESFLFERQVIAVETEITPVRFVSRTSFDLMGFEEQCIRASVGFSGVLLYTGVLFDLGGIREASFGFELTF